MFCAGDEFVSVDRFPQPDGISAPRPFAGTSDVPLNRSFDSKAPLVTWSFHSSGIEVDESVFVFDGRMSRLTLPSAPPSNESWNVISAARLPPRSTSREPSEAPRSTLALFGLLAPGTYDVDGWQLPRLKLTPVGPVLPTFGETGQPFAGFGVGVLPPRSRRVTGSLKLTRAAFLSQECREIARGL